MKLFTPESFFCNFCNFNHFQQPATHGTFPKFHVFTLLQGTCIELWTMWTSKNFSVCQLFARLQPSPLMETPVVCYRAPPGSTSHRHGGQEAVTGSPWSLLLPKSSPAALYAVAEAIFSPSLPHRYTKAPVFYLGFSTHCIMTYGPKERRRASQRWALQHQVSHTTPAKHRG